MATLKKSRMSRTSGLSPAIFPRATPIGKSSPPKLGNEVGKLAMGRVAARYLTFCLLAALLAVIGSSVVALAEGNGPIVFPDTQYEPVEWTDLEGWSSDDHAAAFAAFLGSCRTIQARRRPIRELTAIPDALKEVCEEARQA